MNILLIGSGGREHALAWKLTQSHHCDSLFIAPGNAGTSAHGANVDIAITDFEAHKSLCLEKKIDMVVVGPEEPLVKGIHDFFRSDEQLRNILVVGPSAAAAQLEGSKDFSKKFMQRHNIPTASYAVFTLANAEEGENYIRAHPLPIVLKADGLAAGKGVVICQDHEEAVRVFEDMVVRRQFGDAGNKVVIESFLQGIEVSVFVLTDGKDYQVIGHAKDYKRIGEGDTGPNTGGMGCVTPVPFMDAAFMQKVEDRIIRPTVKGIEKEQLVYNGFIFFGLMNCGGEPFVIEYNCRLGDPETEVVIPALRTDLVALLAAMDNGTLVDVNISFDERSFVTVMAVSGGYPGAYQKGHTISGLNSFEAAGEVKLFQAGTKQVEGSVCTSGGRVLAVTAPGDSIAAAANHATEAMKKIAFEGMFYRKDIGYEFK